MKKILVQVTFRDYSFIDKALDSKSEIDDFIANLDNILEYHTWELFIQ